MPDSSASSVATSGAPAAGTVTGQTPAPGTESPVQRGWVRRLLPYVTQYRLQAFAAIIAALLSMGGTAGLPLMLKIILDRVIVARHGRLHIWLALLLGLGIVRLVFAGLRRYVATWIALRIEYDMRNDIYDHLQRLDFARHDEMQTGQLVSRANTDVKLVQNVLNIIPLLSSNVVMFAIALVIMFILSPLMTVVALLALPAVMAVAHRMSKVVYPSSWDAQQKAAEVAGVVEEAVTGVRVVKAFGQEDRELGRLVDAAGNLFGTRLRNIFMMARYTPLMQTIPVMAQAAVLALGGWLVINDQVTIGTFLAFSTYLTQLVAPIRMLANFLAESQMARAGAERIFEILDSTPVVTERPGAPKLHELEGRITFEDVTFGYMRSEPVLRDFNLEVEAGEVVALVGASGSGKSTVALLIPRFYDLHGGRVLVDELDVTSVSLRSLRRQIGVVFEESFLFSDSIRENIAYGRPEATMEEVEAAAKAAGAHGFVCDLPDKYETVVGERGLTLSGGQRQRVALARAILANPRILILDDATSSVDARTEEEIHNTLRELMPGRTTLIIAHRKSTLDLADRIVVVEKGRVLDHGTHEQLMDRCPLYRDLLAGPGDDLDRLPPEPLQPEPVQRLTQSAWPRLEDEPPERAEQFFQRLAWGVEPPTPELLASIEALPPVTETPDINIEEHARHNPTFNLRTFLGPHKRSLGLALILVFAEAGLTLSIPWLTRLGIDRGMLRDVADPIWVFSTAVFVVAVADLFVLRAATRYTGRIAQRLLYGMRVRVFAQLQRLGVDYYDSEMAGRVMTRMTSDIEALQQLFQQGILQALFGLVSFGGAAFVMFAMNAKLAAWVMLIVPLLAFATRWYRNRAEQAYERVRDRIAAVNANLQESISGVRVAQAYVRERRNMVVFREIQGEHLDARMESNRISSTFFPFIEYISTFAQAVVLGVGASLVAGNELTPGQLIAFVLYLTAVFAPIQQLSQVFDTYQQARAAMTKLRDLMAYPISTPVADDAPDPGRVHGDIRFSGVRFAYPTAPTEALRGVDLEIPSGQSVALVGETGAGKSTIVKLVARFYDPTAGSVLVDGKPLSSLDLGAFRRRLGYVPQEAFLFTGTIRDNISYGRPEATDAEVEAAARAVGAHDFIAGLSFGYHEPVTERGRSLSSGQRQLIALARAYLVDPSILLLDEATSNLDLATEAKVTKAMRLVSTGRTTMVIAHRLQTAKRCDRILVVSDGRIIEDGSHDDLIALGGSYSALWSSFSPDDADSASGPLPVVPPAGARPARETPRDGAAPPEPARPEPERREFEPVATGNGRVGRPPIAPTSGNGSSGVRRALTAGRRSARPDGNGSTARQMLRGAIVAGERLLSLATWDSPRDRRDRDGTQR